MKWFFIPQLPGQVETEVTQRDQFKNDEVDLADTIVRESVQNSLDAATNESSCVRVSFRWVDSHSGLDSPFMRSLFEGHLDHAALSLQDLDKVDFSNPVALVIEDFGTKGLTGSVTEKDDDNFSDFWRRHGKSHKTGKSRGRWGLGKLVYSTASQLSAFFGATVRQSDKHVYVMGQTVLGLRKFQGIEYPPHAFFSDTIGEDLLTRIQVPLRDQTLVQQFIDQFALERGTQPGLSVIIPFPTNDLTRDRMIGVAIENYFYPLLTGQLVLQFDDIEINSGNTRELARAYAAEKFQDIDTLFDFITETYEAQDADLLVMNESWLDDQILGENDFHPDDVQLIRQRFAEGQLVGLKLPLTITTKAGEERKTSFAVFIKRPENLSRGRDIYVRGGLTLPQEAKFRERKALGAMIAEDEAICSFLGDAENAAHTRWISNAEKLRRNYRNPQRTLTVIKKSVLDLYDLLAEVTEELDEQALSAFFWTDEPEGLSRNRKPKKSPLDIPAPPEPKPKLFYISESETGFSVGSTQQAASDQLPQTVRITVAYEVASGDPFKKYDPRDFRLGANSSIDVGFTKETANVIARKDNVLEFEVHKLPFKLKATGFDENRDLRVKLETGV